MAVYKDIFYMYFCTNVLLVKKFVSNKDKEAIKVEVPKRLAEEFRKYVANKYGLRRGALSKAIIDLIEKELGYEERGENDISNIVGLGL